MVNSVQEHAEFLFAGAFVESMYRMIDVANDRLENAVQEDLREISFLLDGDRPKNMHQGYLLCGACRLIDEAGSITLSDLAKGLLVDKYECTSLADWMSDKGLSECARDTDGSIVRIWLTSKGCQLRKVMDGVLLQEIDSVLKKLSHDEQIIFVRLFQKLVTA